MRFDENPFTCHCEHASANMPLRTCQCEKEDKKVEGFQISHFYWFFLSDVMAVKVTHLV